MTHDDPTQPGGSPIHHDAAIAGRPDDSTVNGVGGDQAVQQRAQLLSSTYDLDQPPGGAVFRFDFDRWARVPLGVLGVTPERCEVRVGSRDVLIRFGVLRTRLDRNNVRAAQVVGPFAPWKALGLRLSLADHGLTFGTTAAGGVCIELWRPVALLLPGRVLRHPAITVTVASAAQFANTLAVSTDGHKSRYSL